ncbi:hypothetical protein ACP70R_029861 [Stipagrostis hirtigluma subsp. patula]
MGSYTGVRVQNLPNVVYSYTHTDYVRCLMWQGRLVHRRRPTTMNLGDSGDSDDSFRVEKEEDWQGLGGAAR